MSGSIINVAEAKRRFSDLLNQVVYHNKRFLIARHGRPLAGMIPASEMINHAAAMTPQSFLSLVGLWSEFEDLEQTVKEIYAQRENEVARPIPNLDGL